AIGERSSASLCTSMPDQILLRSRRRKPWGHARREEKHSHAGGKPDRRCPSRQGAAPNPGVFHSARPLAETTRQNLQIAFGWPSQNRTVAGEGLKQIAVLDFLQEDNGRSACRYRAAPRAKAIFHHVQGEARRKVKAARPGKM